MSTQLNEVFDIDAPLEYPVVNMNPKYKIPQVWHFGVPGTDTLMARLMQFTGKETVKQYKRGDNIAEVFLLSGTSHGHAVPLKGGLGDKPIDAIHLIFRTVWDSIKLTRPDVVLFRFPSKKMKGQQFAIIRIMERLVKQSTQGRYRVLTEASGLGNKNAFVIMYRKGAELLSVDGMPPVPEKYKKTETKAGDVYIDTNNGEKVSKSEIAAEILVDASNKKSDQTVAKMTKISRRALAKSFVLDNFDGSIIDKDWEVLDNTAYELNLPAIAEEIDDNGIIQRNITAHKVQTDLLAYAGSRYLLEESGINSKSAQYEMLKDAMISMLESKFNGKAPLSIDIIQSYSEFILNILDTLKDGRMEKYRESYKTYIPMVGYEKPEFDIYVEQQWDKDRVQILKESVKRFTRQMAPEVTNLFSVYESTGYSKEEYNAVSNYTGSIYLDMNNYLLGKYTEQNHSYPLHEVKKTIKYMDSAFTSAGVKLPEGVTLYRAQRLQSNKWVEMAKNKVFYFRNYVSTSINPIIFGGWQASHAVGVTPDEFRDEINAQTGTDYKNQSEIVSVDAPKPEDLTDGFVDIQVGWVITGAEKLNVLVPGKVSAFPGEMEVILPRGTTVQINNVIDSSNMATKDNNQKLVKAEVMTSDQLDESTPVYDGDALIESGEIKLMDFSKFLTEVKTITKKESASVLASLISLDIPEKFIQ